MDPRSSRLPSAPPDAGCLVLWQGLIGALGTLAADCDRLWCQRRRVLDTLPVMLLVFRLVFVPRRHGYPTALAELWPGCRALVVPLSLPVSDTAPSQARLELDENGFQPCHAEILRRPAPAGPPGWLTSRLLVQTRPPVDFDLVAHGSERRAARAQHPEGLPLRQRVCIGGPLEPICARTAGTRDTPCARSRNGPDADTAGRGNGHALTPCKRQKHSNSHPKP